MDQGLLQGLSEGLKQGLLSYTDAADKKYRREIEAKKLQREEEDREERLGLLREQRENEKIKLGMKKDDTGKWVPDPESEILKRKKQESQLLDAQVIKTQAEAKKALSDASRARGGSAPTQKLSAGGAENLAGSETALQSLKDAKTLSEQNSSMFGKASGLLGSAASALGTGNVGTTAASIDADLLSKAQTIGRYLEGGKLAEADIARYTKMLPSRFDNPDVVKNKVATLERLIQQKYNADLKNYKNAGFDVGSAQPIDVTSGLIKGAGPEDPQIANYAKQYGLSYDKAKSIIDKRRGQ